MMSRIPFWVAAFAASLLVLFSSPRAQGFPITGRQHSWWRGGASRPPPDRLPLPWVERVGARPLPGWRRFSLLVEPLIWKVSLDGQPVSRYRGAPSTLQVPPGRHVLHFRHPAVWPIRVVIGAEQPSGPIRGQLRWRPATLVVRFWPPRAGAAYRFLEPVWLKQLGPLPAEQPLSIRFRRLAPQPARIQIYAEGYAAEERQVVLFPNRRLLVPVTLIALRTLSRVRRRWQVDRPLPSWLAGLL